MTDAQAGVAVSLHLGDEGRLTGRIQQREPDRGAGDLAARVLGLDELQGGADATLVRFPEDDALNFELADVQAVGSVVVHARHEASDGAEAQALSELFLDTRNDLGRTDLEGARQGDDRVQGGRAETALEHADVGPMQIAGMAETLLRVVGPATQFAKDDAECLGRAQVLARHGRKIAENRLMIDRL